MTVQESQPIHIIKIRILLSEFLVLSKARPRAQGLSLVLRLRRGEANRLAPGVGRAGWRGTGPVEAEKDPGEQGVQVEAPAGARPTRQPLNSTAPLHARGHPPHRSETEQTPYKIEQAAAEAFRSRTISASLSFFDPAQSPSNS